MLKLIIFIFFFLGSIPLKGESVSKICENWFKEAQVPPGSACVYNCVMSKTDVQTECCALFCPDLCESNYAGIAFFKITKLYPGMTLAERAIVSSYPTESLSAYAFSWKAVQACHKIYLSSQTNDESDACRHYLWAGLLTKSLGQEMAQKILDAHEDEPDQPLEEKSMDLANNRAGILACLRLKENNNCDDTHLLDEYKKDLNSGRLIILKPRSKEKHK